MRRWSKPRRSSSLTRFIPAKSFLTGNSSRSRKTAHFCSDQDEQQQICFVGRKQASAPIFDSGRGSGNRADSTSREYAGCGEIHACKYQPTPVELRARPRASVIISPLDEMNNQHGSAEKTRLTKKPTKRSKSRQKLLKTKSNAGFKSKRCRQLHVTPPIQHSNFNFLVSLRSDDFVTEET